MRLYSAITERLTLYCLMEQPKLARDLLPKLDESLFGLEPARAIFIRLLKLIAKGSSIPKVRVMALDAGLKKDAQQILQPDEEDLIRVRTWEGSDATHAVDQLKHYYQKRVVYEMINSLSSDLNTYAKPDIEEIKGKIQTHLVKVDRFVDEDSIKTIGLGGNITNDYLEEHLKPQSREIIPTGFKAIDKNIQGWRRGNLVVLTAMRGKGKSVLAKSLGINMFYSKHSVYTCNLEMQDWEYLIRFYAETSDYAQRALRRGFAERKDVAAVIRHHRQLNAFGKEAGCRWTLNTIKQPNFGAAQLHQMLKHQGYDVVVVDYLNLLNMGMKELWQNIYAATKYLKMMAKDLNVLVIALGQLTDDNRAKYARAVEEDADVWIWWDIIPGQYRVHMKHGKARDYDPFPFELIFDGQKTRFMDSDETKIKANTLGRIKQHAIDSGKRILEQMREERAARQQFDWKKTPKGEGNAANSRRRQQQPSSDAQDPVDFDEDKGV